MVTTRSDGIAVLVANMGSADSDWRRNVSGYCCDALNMRLLDELL